MMDKNAQRAVWQRVYPEPKRARPLPVPQLRRCLQRLGENLRVYESQQGHPVYGPAFQHLTRQTREQMQMLRQMLEG